MITRRGIIDPYDLSDQPDEWVVLRQYVFYSRRLQQQIIIPQWFVTDLASIPRIFRSFLTVNDRHRLASLPHDLFYAYGSITRAEADAVLYEQCIDQGVPKWKAAIMYAAVRAGGWAVWRKRASPFAPVDHREWYAKQYGVPV